MDAYGNVRPLYEERRAVGIFQNEVQRRALRGYQDVGRRENQRGGLVPFVLPGDMMARTRAYRAVDPLHPQDVPFTVRKAFERYGGFGHRAGQAQRGELPVILGRREAILTATSRTAPVQRALWQYGGVSELSAPAAEEGVVPPDGELVAPAQTLTERLERSAARLSESALTQGRAHFREGAFRQAARAFQEAYTLDPEQLGARVREVFCHLAMGSMRTASVLMAALLRRHADPFVLELDLSGEFGRSTDLRDVRLRTSLLAQPGGQENAVALHAFTLWYLGERTESLLTAEALAADHPDGIYASWPDRMRSAGVGGAAEQAP